MELGFRFINYKQVVPYMNTSWETQMFIDIGSFWMNRTVLSI